MVTINKQPVVSAEAQSALDKLSSLDENKGIFKDGDIGDDVEASRLVNPNQDYIVGDDDLNLWNQKLPPEKALKQSELQALAGEFAKKFPTKSEKFAVSTFWSMGLTAAPFPAPTSQATAPARIDPGAELAQEIGPVLDSVTKDELMNFIKFYFKDPKAKLSQELKPFSTRVSALDTRKMTPLDPLIENNILRCAPSLSRIDWETLASLGYRKLFISQPPVMDSIRALTKKSAVDSDFKALLHNPSNPIVSAYVSGVRDNTNGDLVVHFKDGSVMTNHSPGFVNYYVNPGESMTTADRDVVYSMKNGGVITLMSPEILKELDAAVKPYLDTGPKGPARAFDSNGAYNYYYPMDWRMGVK